MFSCKNLIVVIIAVYLITGVLKEDTHKIIVGGATLLFLYTNVEGLEDGQNQSGFDDEKSDAGNSIIGNNTVEAGGAKPGPVNVASNVNTGPYDGLCLKTGNDEYWMKSPDETSLVPNDTLYTYLSSQGPIKMKLSDQSALRGPPVDGVKGSAEKMFMWANNITSPLCCPSTFSTSTGCVCSTKNQRDFVAARGMLDGTADEIEV
tara:strand:+ start:844 stop:1458 length:615 start_codon:yes stop_codon:yes gene_type:complete